jgi:hypothetical protein
MKKKKKKKKQKKKKTKKKKTQSFLGRQSNHDPSDFHPVAQSLYRLKHPDSTIKIIW